MLTAVADQGPPGFERVHSRAWSATVPLSETEIFERVYTAELDDIPVRLLRVSGPTAEVLLLTDDPTAAERVGAGLVEPGTYEIIIDRTRLANAQAVENQLRQPS